MTSYDPPLDDIRFLLRHVTPLEDLAALPTFEHVDAETVDGLLAEAGRLCREVVAPTNRDGDVEGSRLSEGGVTTPVSFRRAYERWVEAGWGALGHPREYGGGGFPLLVATAVREMLTSANMALSLCPVLTASGVLGLLDHGSETQRETYLPPLVAGEWTATMALTEPQAGSDLRGVTTRAEPDPDGTWRLTGQKIFITWGDHDLADQIVHFVLARTPDAPAGTAGLSLFLVPKWRVRDDGSLGERNDVACVGVEEKLGIHGSPTCVMAFGERDGGAAAELVGERHRGLQQMFTLMNDARLAIGLEGPAVAERARQQATAHARQRRQGSAPGTPEGEQAPIVEHPDVRRMLLTMRARTEAMRALCYLNARAIDLSRRHPDGDVRSHQGMVADLLTPVSKAWCTDRGVEVTSLNVQVHGGMGYVEETGAAQLYRDVRIAPIYEGTNGIQAIDLVTRKLELDGGRFVLRFIAGLRDVLGALEGGELAPVGHRLETAIDALEDATDWLLDRRDQPEDLQAAASPYLRLFGLTVGGWLLARSAVAAQRLIDRGDGEALHEAKLVTARFYAEHLLPAARGLAVTATRGADDLLALSAGEL